MKKSITIIATLTIVWVVWYLVGDVLLGLTNVFEYGLIIISGAIAGFLVAPLLNNKKSKK